MTERVVETVYRESLYTDDKSNRGHKNTNISNSESVYYEDGTCVHYEESLYIEEPIEINVDITKSNEPKRLVSGWASVAKSADGSIPLDWQGDIIPIDVLEKAAINFMLDYRGSGEMHKGEPKGTVVESIVFTKEKMKSMGIPTETVPEGWFVTVKIHDEEVFEKVRSGDYKMFSIQGKAKRLKT